MKIPDVVHRYVDAFARCDSDGCAQCFAPHGTYSDPSHTDPMLPEDISKSFGNVFMAFPDAITETIALDPISDQTTVWRWIIRGTHRDTYAGVPATGRSIELPGCEFIEVSGGLIQKVEGYFDRMTLLAQLGLAPSPAAPRSA